MMGDFRVLRNATVAHRPSAGGWLRNCLITRDLEIRGGNLSQIATLVANCNKRKACYKEDVLSTLGGQVVFLQFSVQGRAVNAQGPSGLGDVMGRDLKGADQCLPFDFCQRQDRRRNVTWGSRSHDRRKLGREVARLQHIRRLQHDRVLNGVLQLANIAGPIVLQQQVANAAVEMPLIDLPLRSACFLKKMFDQRKNVFTAFPQGRKSRWGKAARR